MSTTPPKEPDEPTAQVPAEDPFAQTEQVEGLEQEQAPPKATGTMDWPTFGMVIALLLTLGVGAITPYKAFGLPLHPMINHFAVVFIPALAITTLIVIWKESWRRAWALPLAIGGVVTTAVTSATVKSGKDLKSHLFPRVVSNIRGRVMDNQQHLISQHAHAAGWLQWIVFAFAVVLVGHFVIGRLHTFDKHWLKLVFQILATVLAAITLIVVVYVGHLGAEAVWQQRGGPTPTTRINPGGPFANGNGGGFGNRFGNGSGGVGGGQGRFGGGTTGGGGNATTPRLPFQRRGTTTTTVPGATTTTSTTVGPTA